MTGKAKASPKRAVKGRKKAPVGKKAVSRGKAKASPALLPVGMTGIYHGDCLDLMDNIPDGSVDMVLTDLPYAMTDCKWDKHILDFDALWKQWNRVCKPNAPVLLFASGIFLAQCIMSNPKNYKYKWVWAKPQGTNFGNAKRMPLRQHEDIAVFYRKQPTYNPQMWQGKPYKHTSGKPEIYGGGAMREGYVTESNGERHPLDVLHYDRERVDKGRHPTQKPVELLRYLIKTYTDRGDMVLDSTCGSGSACLAAALEGREYIGIELDGDYHMAAVERVGNLGAYEPTPRLDGM